MHAVSLLGNEPNSLSLTCPVLTYPAHQMLSRKGNNMGKKIKSVVPIMVLKCQKQTERTQCSLIHK